MSSETAAGQRVRRVLVGVDIGGTKTAVTLSCDPPHLLARSEFPTAPELGPSHAIEQIKSAIRSLLPVHGFGVEHLLALGVSCGGPLNRSLGLVQSPPNLRTWVDVPITQMLSEEFHVPCRLENDANAGAVAEHRFGAGRGTRNMVFLTMGTGLGAGIILDGQLHHGSSDMAGEIGHVRLTPDGPMGHNKNGSAEGWASGSGMTQSARQMVQEALRSGESTSLQQVIEQDELTARSIGTAAEAGDVVAQRIIAKTGERLGEALAILVDILNPECIVIGGLAMRLGERLLGPARSTLAREALQSSVERCRVVPACLGENIGDIAALCVATGLEARWSSAEGGRT